MSQRKKKIESTPTRVALVCLKTTQNNIQINNQSLLKVFSKHGSISKILIFERGQLQTKLIPLQMQSSMDSILYSRSLNNTKILNQISCNVYHSRLKQLKLDTVPYTKGLDFTNPPSNTGEQMEWNEEQQEIARINQWEDFQFDNDSTDEVSDEEEPQFSEEKMIDIITKLNQIDDEINKTIETKIVTALDKLHQNTMCIQVLITYDILNDMNFVMKIFCLFGQIKYLKQSQVYIYIKYGSNQQCQKAFTFLKDYLEIKLQYNFENANGKLIQPNNIIDQNLQETLDDQLAIQELFQSYKIIKQQNNSLIQIKQ
ncbi:unnamed protein product (macronuclear) [Paramecium tetraurelia]|uniref:RRM domain-containing protein n=1 Tax=Paramecium tetraurelia TaxID=5888 RepID=A0CU92_PARTE|nr:uncharacterized protein GSPATT00010558001 [Paramecium tetraurelia]CAK74359.1 unnamed protein product [Paramecium tetraurelia]|eukprot:XP_001441756.1 hypothetical protein (macronuclear) [Paramecium tetraurelia strain d4-2]